MNTALKTLVVILLCIGMSACLKTRAQLREEESGTALSTNGKDASPTATSQPAQVKDVAPDGQYALDEIKGELTRQNGRIEDLEKASKDGAANATTASKDDLKKLEARVIELEQAQANMLDAIKKMQDSQTVAADPIEAFKAGKDAYESQSYDVAITQLSAYLKDPKGRHAEEATFLRGESYFQLKQYKKAIVDFSKFPEKYTHSKIMPRALLRIAQSFDALGMKDDASGFYQELQDKYPKSPEAKKAKGR